MRTHAAIARAVLVAGGGLLLLAAAWVARECWSSDLAFELLDAITAPIERVQMMFESSTDDDAAEWADTTKDARRLVCRANVRGRGPIECN